MGRSTDCARIKYRGAVLMFVFVACASSRLQADLAGAKQAEKVPAQMAVLKRFAGNWRTRTTLRRPGPPEQEIKTSGKAICRGTLGGRYYEFHAETDPAADSDLQLMTYDEPAGVYRQWVFSSDGYRHEATGVWDEASSTMTWKGKTASGTFVIEDRWASPDLLEWTLVRKDVDGNVTQTISGTVSRAK